MVRAARAGETRGRYAASTTAPVVVDASIAAAWFVNEPGRRGAIALLESGVRLLAPDLMAAEAANAWWKTVRRGGMQVVDAEQYVLDTECGIGAGDLAPGFRFGDDERRRSRGQALDLRRAVGSLVPNEHVGHRCGEFADDNFVALDTARTVTGPSRDPDTGIVPHQRFVTGHAVARHHNMDRQGHLSTGRYAPQHFETVRARDCRCVADAKKRRAHLVRCSQPSA